MSGYLNSNSNHYFLLLFTSYRKRVCIFHDDSINYASVSWYSMSSSSNCQWIWTWVFLHSDALQEIRNLTGGPLHHPLIIKRIYIEHILFHHIVLCSNTNNTIFSSLNISIYLMLSSLVFFITRVLYPFGIGSTAHNEWTLYDYVWSCVDLFLLFASIKLLIPQITSRVIIYYCNIFASQLIEIRSKMCYYYYFFFFWYDTSK